LGVSPMPRMALSKNARPRIHYGLYFLFPPFAEGIGHPAFLTLRPRLVVPQNTLCIEIRSDLVI
jgi:hypothetical protein